MHDIRWMHRHNRRSAQCVGNPVPHCGAALLREEKRLLLNDLRSLPQQIKILYHTCFSYAREYKKLSCKGVLDTAWNHCPRTEQIDRSPIRGRRSYDYGKHGIRLRLTICSNYIWKELLQVLSFAVWIFVLCSFVTAPRGSKPDRDLQAADFPSSCGDW